MKGMKGNIADQIFITVIFLAFCMATILAYLIWSTMTPPLEAALTQANGGVLASGSEIAINQVTSTLLMFDSLFIFMIIGSFVAILISSFWLDTHPVFFIISFLVFLFSIVIFAILGNVYGEFVNTQGIQAAAANYPLMTAFWSNVPTIAAIFIVALIIIIYSKMRKGSGNNAYGA